MLSHSNKHVEIGVDEHAVIMISGEWTHLPSSKSDAEPRQYSITN